jgi:cell division protein FtsQ
MNKKIVNSILIVLLSGGLFVLLSFVNKAKNETTCQELIVNIKNNQDLQFIDYDEIQKTLSEQGIKLVGNQLKNIDIPKIERIINAHPHIKKADVYAELNGNIHIDVLQRKPVIRVFNIYNESFYIDEDGTLMPTSTKHIARVPIANGFIFDKYDTFYKINLADTTTYQKVFKYSLLDDLYILGKTIYNDSVWNKQIQQVYVEKEIELIPRVGEQQIILGDVSNLHEKLNKLKIFYKEAIPKVGWNKYSKINLKFKNQVVCTKAK